MKKILLAAAAVLCLAVTGCESMTTKPTEEETKEQTVTEPGIMPEIITAAEADYCGTWACSQYLTEPHNMPPVPLDHSSIRQTVRTSIPGNAIRIKLSNLCGEREMVIKSVHIALAVETDTKVGKIDTATDTIVTFGGEKAVTIPAGEEIYSDTFAFNLPALAQVSISIAFGRVPDKLTGHPGSRTTSCIELGNLVSQEKFSRLSSTEHWYAIAAIDVADKTEKKAAVCFGDSITDGRGSTTDHQNRWTDNLATRLNANENTKNIAVLNEGIGGTLVSSSGVNRFRQDVLDQCNVKYILMLYGINDIIYINASADTVIEVYKGLIKKAHKAGILIYGGTILPFGKCGDYSEKRDEVRQTVNEWIRNTTPENGGFDAYVDFDAVMRDPENEKNMLAEYNCGDGLHPSAKGYVAMADAIDTELFTRTGDFSDAAASEPLVIESAQFFQFPLPKPVLKNQQVEVHVKGKNNGETGFRSWLIDSAQMTNSNVYDKKAFKALEPGDFEITYTLTAYATANSLFFKGPVYGTNIEGLEIHSVSVIIDGKEIVFDPSDAAVTK